MLTLVDATFDDIIKQMQQDKIYSMTLQNEVKGLGRQRKTMTDIYKEGEEEQKQRAVRYVETLHHVMKSKSHLWNEIKQVHTRNHLYQILLHFIQMNM